MRAVASISATTCWWLRQLNLEKVGDDGDTSNYIPNTEWALTRLREVGDASRVSAEVTRRGAART